MFNPTYFGSYGKGAVQQKTGVGANQTTLKAKTGGSGWNWSAIGGWGRDVFGGLLQSGSQLYLEKEKLKYMKKYGLLGGPSAPAATTENKQPPQPRQRQVSQFWTQTSNPNLGRAAAGGGNVRENNGGGFKLTPGVIALGAVALVLLGRR